MLGKEVLKVNRLLSNVFMNPSSPKTIKRVYCEICTMAQVHHPNLVQFIAAVLDDQGGPMIITELLDTTLRKAYEDSMQPP